MKTVALVAPFANPHFLNIFDSPAFSRDWKVDRFCFRSLPSHRGGLGWQEADYQTLSSSYLRIPQTQKAVSDYEVVIYYGAIDPRCIPALMMRCSLKRGQKTFLATEGIRYKHPRWRSLAFSILLNDPRLEVLAIGDRCAEDFRNAGLTDPTYRKFGFFENYKTFDGRSSTDGNSCRILSVGQLIDRKNFLTIIHSLQRLATNISQTVTYTICGEGTQRPEIEAAISKLPDNIKVELLGNCNAQQLDQCFCNSDIFAMPSTYDGWGVVLNQAIHYQLPVVVSSGVRSARDHLVQNAHNGFIFETESELDEQLIQLIQDSQLRASFANISAEISSDWHIDAVAKNLAIIIDGEEPLIDRPFAPLIRV